MNNLLVISVLLMYISCKKNLNASVLCPAFCTFDYEPTCGFDGTCYREFQNPCHLEADRNCNGYKDLFKVYMTECDQASTDGSTSKRKC